VAGYFRPELVHFLRRTSSPQRRQEVTAKTSYTVKLTDPPSLNGFREVVSLSVDL